MQNIDHDIEEYDGKHCSDSDNGIDVPEYDNFEYIDLAERAGLLPVVVHIC